MMCNMRTVPRLMSPLLMGLGMACGATYAATPPCESFKWDVSHEHTLFMGTATALNSGASLATAPVIVPDRLYELKLVPQQDTKFMVEPHRRDPADGVDAGLVSLHLNALGRYRVSSDAAVWIDVIDDGAAVRAIDFQGQKDCAAPHKVVEFEIGALQVLIQVSGSDAATVKLAVTRVAAARGPT